MSIQKDLENNEEIPFTRREMEKILNHLHKKMHQVDQLIEKIEAATILASRTTELALEYCAFCREYMKKIEEKRNEHEKGI